MGFVVLDEKDANSFWKFIFLVSDTGNQKFQRASERGVEEGGELWRERGRGRGGRIWCIHVSRRATKGWATRVTWLQKKLWTLESTNHIRSGKTNHIRENLDRLLSAVDTWRPGCYCRFKSTYDPFFSSSFFFLFKSHFIDAISITLLMQMRLKS